MRHGDAEPKTTSDLERRLTKIGVAQVTRALAIASELGATVRVIASSPLLRAKQTAEIAQRLFQVQKIEIDPVLGPDSSPLEVFRHFAGMQENEILLVSHQPLVSQLIATLLGWHEEAFVVRPGCIVKIEVDDLSKDPPPIGRLIFFLPPGTG